MENKMRNLINIVEGVSPPADNSVANKKSDQIYYLTKAKKSLPNLISDMTYYLTQAKQAKMGSPEREFMLKMYEAKKMEVETIKAALRM